MMGLSVGTGWVILGATSPVVSATTSSGTGVMLKAIWGVVVAIRSTVGNEVAFCTVGDAFCGNTTFE